MSSLVQRTLGSNPAARQADRTARPHAASSGGSTQSATGQSGERRAVRARPAGRHGEHQVLDAQRSSHDVVRQRERDVVVLVDDRDVGVAGEQGRQRAGRLGDRRRPPRSRRARAARSWTAAETKVTAALATAATRTGPAEGSADPVEVGAGRLQHVEHLAGPRRERATGRGERDPAGRAVDQRRAGLALEQGELLGHRRGGQSERARRAGDRAAQADLAEHPQPADVQDRAVSHKPNLRHRLASHKQFD